MLSLFSSVSTHELDIILRDLSEVPLLSRGRGMLVSGMFSLIKSDSHSAFILKKHLSHT